MATTYDMTTAIAVCNDATADTWEVQAKETMAGQWWTVSDSSEMDEAEAKQLAAQMRRDA